MRSLQLVFRSMLAVACWLSCFVLTFGSTSSYAYDGVCGSSTAVAELPAGHWCRVPNSKVASLAPSPLPLGAEGQEAVMTGWSGGALDTKRNRLLVWGGGHNAYAGNEIYSFDMQTLKWSIVWGPTPNSLISDVDAPHETYGDGNPSSRHTYDNLTYDPVHDALWSCDGSLWRIGYASGVLWRFEFGKGQWVNLGSCPDGGIYSQTGYDPVSNAVVRQSNHAIYRFNFAGDTWTKLSDAGSWNTASAGEVDAVAQKFVVAGGNEFGVLDLKTNQYSTPQLSGDTSVRAANSPGMAFDSKQKAIVAWTGGTDVKVLRISGNTYTWQVVAPNAGNLTTPTTPTTATMTKLEPRGTYGRFQYVAALNVFVLVNRVQDDVYIYRMSDGAGQVKPAAPTNLVVQ